MKVFLLHRDRDFDMQRPLPAHEPELMQDLELGVMLGAMARGDRFLFEVARRVVLCGENDLDTLRYRQAILQDCLNNPAVVREIYQITIDSIENKRRQWLGMFGREPAAILSGAVKLMQMFLELLRGLRAIADQHADGFESKGFARFFAAVKTELDDEYLAAVEHHLQELGFRRGILLSAELGPGNEGAGYVLRRPNAHQGNRLTRALTQRSPVYTFHIHPRDEYGARAVSDLKERGMNLVANALAQSADHIDSFFEVLRIELAFYIACLNLHAQLGEIGHGVCFPTLVAPDERRHSFAGLYDVCLALTMNRQVVGNAVMADKVDLVTITGANQGGKSTFLRSIGLAQLMMQCGMFVPADSFCANLCAGLFTHFKRKEDAAMKSGKLDEELSRMSVIVDRLTPNALVLFNESFAATNEREGSEIARQIVSALVERRVKVFFVTHLYALARGFYDTGRADTIFLVAERRADGERTFKMVEGEPTQTSYGKDLYHSVFGNPESGGLETVANSPQSWQPYRGMRSAGASARPGEATG